MRSQATASSAAKTQRESACPESALPGLVQLPDRRCDLPTPQILGLIPADGHKTDGIGLQQAS